MQGAEAGVSVTLTQAGRSPDDSRIDARFALQLAIANQDLPILTELWGSQANQQYWTSEHLAWALEYLLTESPKLWQAGFNYLAKANSVTEGIVASITYPEQQGLALKLFMLRPNLHQDAQKALDEALSQRAFVLTSTHLLVTIQTNLLPSQDAVRVFIDRSHMDISKEAVWYLRHTDPEGYLAFRQGLEAFKTLEEPHRVCIQHVLDLLAKYEDGFQHDFSDL